MRKKYIYVEKKRNQILPNDIMNEVVNQLPTYDQSLLCGINKQIKCTKNVKILIDNIKYKKIAIDKNTFIICNDKLYSNILIANGKIMRKREFFEIKTPGIPLSVSCTLF